MAARLLASPQVPPELRAAFLLPETHVSALTRLIGLALTHADAASALALAGRRCRIAPIALAADHLLRAEAARLSGDLRTAREAMRRAYELDPTDVAVNQGVIALLGEDEAREAARRLIATPTAHATALKSAITRLVADGEPVLAAMDPRGRHLAGWVVWPAGETLTLRLVAAGEVISMAPAPESGHPLSGPGRWAAALHLPRPDPGPIAATFTCGSGQQSLQIVSATVGGAASRPTDIAIPGPFDLSVIVPAYEDAERTAACLDSLARQIVPDHRWRTIVVDDHSPNPRLVEDLSRRAARGEITLLSHDSNRGFAAAVNAAAALVPEGDILLLNADTLLPPGALARLLRAAAEPGVGTVTPLSNNGEVTSFPKPYAVNELPAEAELFAWDAAAQAGGGAPVDIPCGIGFCLLVTRACWDAVGGLSHAFGRGYYEDVDLCLRAREHGFRNLCATDVLVGHAGSRSFLGAKRALVVANEAVLFAHHPAFAAEYAAFLHAEPLRPAMARIERRLAPRPHPILLVTAAGFDAPLLSLRRERLARSDRHCLVAILSSGAEGSRVRLRSAGDGIPQSIAFDLPEEGQALLAYLALAEVERVEILEPDRCPADLGEILRGFDRPIDLHLSGPCRPESLTAFPLGERVLCSDAMAECFAAGLPGECPPIVVPPRLDRAPEGPGDTGGLAILSPVACAGSFRLATALAGRAPAGIDLRVLGATLDDLRLMASGPVFADGPLAPTDLAATVARLSPSAIVLPYRTGQAFILEAVRAAHPCPCAYFDWSGGRFRAGAGDLLLDPTLSDGQAAARVLAWFAQIPGVGDQRA